MSVCVVSLLSLSTMVIKMLLKVYLSLYTLLRSHLFVNCCIRRYSLYTTSGPSACRRPPGHPRADDLRAIRVQTDTSETFHNKGTAPYVVGSAPYVASKHVAVAIGTVAVWKTVGATVIVITGAPKANGKFWSHVLDNGSIKCARDHGCGLHVLRNGERIARIPKKLEDPLKRVP